MLYAFPLLEAVKVLREDGKCSGIPYAMNQNRTLLQTLEGQAHSLAVKWTTENDRQKPLNDYF